MDTQLSNLPAEKSAKPQGNTDRLSKIKQLENIDLEQKTDDIKAPLLPMLKSADLSKTAIFLGAGVDPDGLASQAGMAALVEKYNGKAFSFYRGTFNRPQNKSIRQILNLNPLPEKEFKSDDGWTCIISVDGNAKMCPVQPDFIFDHHEQQGEAKIASDIRFIGATSSIIWEYLIADGFDFTDEQGKRISTLLALGIRTDTREGATMNTSDLDYEALCFCLKNKDQKAYTQILNCPRPTYYNDLFVQGWNNKTVEGPVVVSGLGNIPEARSGVISEIATQFCETEGVSTAIVFGMVDGVVDISVRSSNLSLDVNDFVRRAFGSGGGKPGSGRARIETPLFQNLPDNLSTKLFEIINEIVKHKALQITGDKK
jgi:nanoRNase/pAp phosphatase (c-di-AMP/oligoRNAs hydrolase)